MSHAFSTAYQISNCSFIYFLFTPTVVPHLKGGNNNGEQRSPIESRSLQHTDTPDNSHANIATHYPIKEAGFPVKTEPSIERRKMRRRNKW